MTDDFKILELEEEHKAVRRARLARFRKWLRYLPRRSNVSRYPLIRYFAEEARRRPYLWAFRTTEVRRAIYFGTVISFLPIYGLQALLAFWAAMVFRANLGVALAVQFLTPPFYYLGYVVGAFLLRLMGGDTLPGFTLISLTLGGFLVGIVFAALLDVLVRFAVWEAKLLRERHHRVKKAADEVRARRQPAPAPPPATPAVPSPSPQVET